MQMSDKPQESARIGSTWVEQSPTWTTSKNAKIEDATSDSLLQPLGGMN
jgi:hypothetical protein